MLSEAEETQSIKAKNALQEFIRILVKEYPLIFKDGSGEIKVSPSTQQPVFPYKVSLEIRKME